MRSRPTPWVVGPHARIPARLPSSRQRRGLRRRDRLVSPAVVGRSPGGGQRVAGAHSALLATPPISWHSAVCAARVRGFRCHSGPNMYSARGEWRVRGYRGCRRSGEDVVVDRLAFDDHDRGATGGERLDVGAGGLSFGASESRLHRLGIVERQTPRGSSTGPHCRRASRPPSRPRTGAGSGSSRRAERACRRSARRTPPNSRADHT